MKNEIIFKVFGILTFIFELIVIFGLFISNRREPITLDIQTIIKISLFFFLSTTIGIGLIYKKKWAAVGFSSANLSIALWFIVGSFIYVPSPFMFTNFLIGAVFLLIGIAFLLEVFPVIKFKSRLYSNSKDTP
jgi:hypothetical protein